MSEYDGRGNRSAFYRKSKLTKEIRLQAGYWKRRQKKKNGIHGKTFREKLECKKAECTEEKRNSCTEEMHRGNRKKTGEPEFITWTLPLIGTWQTCRLYAAAESVKAEFWAAVSFVGIAVIKILYRINQKRVLKITNKINKFLQIWWMVFNAGKEKNNITGTMKGTDII